MRIYRFDEIDSTNAFLKGRSDLENYDTAITRVQTAGRGRRGNEWKSPEGAALFSFALKEERHLPMEEYRKLPLVAGVAVMRALERTGAGEFLFKWTNDIYLNNKKVSGILVEKIADFFILGIGINVNNSEFGELSHKATSLRREGGIEFVPEEIALSVIEEFKRIYSKFLMGGWNEILGEINQKNFLYGRDVNIDLRSRVDRGRALRVDQDGTLQIEVNGVVKNYDVGEIHISFER